MVMKFSHQLNNGSGKGVLAMKRILVYSLLTAALCTATLLGTGNAAMAQHVNQKKLDKTTFYNAPRQFQILDERPIIKDFREAPVQPQSIELPPGPAGFGGGGGGGAGALPGGGEGGGGGSAPIQLGGPNQGYRSGSPMMPTAGSLPKSGFGPSNIPARGMGPKGPLGDATSTNRLMGKMVTPTKGPAAQARPGGMIPTIGRTAGNYSGPPAATYSGGYGSGSGSGYGGSASRTESMVRGSLLRSK